LFVNVADGGAKLRLNLGLVLEIPAEALGGLVQNLPEQLGVAAERHRRADALQHVLQELRNLPALAGLGLRCLPRRIGLLAEARLRLFGRHGALTGGFLAGVHPRRNRQPDHERRGDRTGGGENEFVPADQLLKPINALGGRAVTGSSCKWRSRSRASSLAVS